MSPPIGTVVGRVVGSYSAYQSGWTMSGTGGILLSATACIAFATFGRPYPYWMLKFAPGLPGQPSDGSSMFEAVSISTSLISPAFSGPSIRWRSAAVRPQAAISAATAPWVGCDSEVVPPSLGIEDR